MAKEGKPVNYASVGNGSFYHLIGEELSKKIGAEMLHVPYKGGGPISQDLLGGQIDLFITPYGAPHVAMEKEGKLRFIAVLSSEPQRLIKHIPQLMKTICSKVFTTQLEVATTLKGYARAYR